MREGKSYRIGLTPYHLVRGRNSKSIFFFSLEFSEKEIYESPEPVLIVKKGKQEREEKKLRQ